jgi:hypothetical protein
LQNRGKQRSGWPLTDQEFIRLLTRVYDPGLPAIFPPEPDENLIAVE